MNISVATTSDRDEIVGSLVAAFSADPVLRHLFPDDETYPAHASAFFGHLFDKRVHRRSIWTVERAAVAIWEPPRAATGSEAVVEPDLPADALLRMKRYDEAVHDAFPEGPFWYLGVLGTAPAHASRGWGRAVMQAGLSQAAAEGLPSVLETSNPRNVEFYRRLGWTVVAEVAAPVRVWVMTQ
ncbi:GNAT family N-acetyltransferase [Actinoplanes sp. NPDC051861]|uniref:GNAT family N-acetyltransferase n=1 Tax=Actinoplanes sp. NPDC051861 TaxID=3155170 RepID=UPI00342B3E29